MKNSFRKHQILPPLSLGLCLFLNACSTTSETFDCPTGKGVGCKSISEVNQMVDQVENRGSLASDVEKGKQSIVLPLSAPIMATDPLIVERDKAAKDTLSVPLSDDMAVHRVSEEHLRVWIAPFQDEHGNLHEGSVIHTVLKPGYWRLNPISQQMAKKQDSPSNPLTGKETQ